MTEQKHIIRFWKQLTGSELLFPAGKKRSVGNPSACKQQKTYQFEMLYGVPVTKCDHVPRPIIEG